MGPKQTIESVYEAFGRGDIPYILGLVAPNAPWRQSGALPWGGDYRGPAGAGDFFRKLDAATETTGFVVNESVEVGNEVFSFGTHSAILKATGKPVTVDWMFRWRVENGKITSYESYVDSGLVVAALSGAAAGAR